MLSGSRANLSHAEEAHSVELKSCGTATGCFGTALTGDAKQGHREAEQRQCKAARGGAMEWHGGASQREATAQQSKASLRNCDAWQWISSAKQSGGDGAATQWQSLALRRFGIAQRGDAWAMPRRTMQRQSSAMRGLGRGAA